MTYPVGRPSQAVATAWEGAWEGRPTGILASADRLMDENKEVPLPNIDFGSLEGGW